MVVIGWTMIAMLFVGMALLMGQNMSAIAVLKSVAVAAGMVGWIWVAVNLVCIKG